MHEAERRFDLDPRTIRRYMRDIKDLGLPLVEVGRGAQRAVFLDPSYRRSGVQLTLGEMISLRFGRTLFNFLEGTGFAQDMNQAIDRLEPSMSRINVDVVQDFDRMFMAVPEPSKDYTGLGDLLDEIISAILYTNPASAEYGRLGAEPRRYLLEPLTLASYRQGLYLFANDPEEAKVKTFAVERFAGFSRFRKYKFERPEGWDPEDFLVDAFGIIGGPPRAVVLRFAASVAEYLQERRWHTTQSIVTRPDGSLEVMFRCSLTPELKQWILGFGAHVEVLEPADLRDEIRETLRASIARYLEE